MHKIPVALVISVLMVPTWGFAETGPGSGGQDRASSAIAIQLPAGRVRERVNREPLRAGAEPLFGQQPAPQRSWRSRHPVLFGALVGVGAGLAVEAVVIPGASGGEPHSAYLPMFGGTGAGVGALIGLIASRR